jgi:tRNA(His) guanylyltransferase
MGNFGDRMKDYERQEAGRRFLPLLPVCARIDGKGFSKFTKGFERPFDSRMSELMCQTTAYLTQETQACIGYTQSDEISLVWYSSDAKSQIFFDRRVQKMVSVLASMTTAFFNAKIPAVIPEKQNVLAMFDCRVWQVPTLEEAANTILWREYDATKNSISMAARHYYSHKVLYKKTGDEMQDMLFEKGVNWNDYPPFFKRGVFVQKRKVVRAFTTEELSVLPEKHEARSNHDLQVERTEYKRIDMPPFGSLANRVGVIFRGEDPIDADHANKLIDMTGEEIC